MPMSMEEGASLFREIAVALPGGETATLEHAAQIVEDEAKRVIGTYEYGWPQLALATQLAREQQGYPANEPLLLTGELRDSIEHYVDEEARVAYVGSNNPKAKWQELGTSRIPPRPFLSMAARAKEAEIVDQVGKAYFTILSGGKIADVTSFLEAATRYLRLARGAI